jgi:short subunit fatty acids transporter
MQKKSFSDRLKKEIFRSWWVIAIILVSSVIYYQGVKNKRDEIKQLQYRICELAKQNQITQEQKENLLERLNAQNDPEWLEQVLIEEMGLVPEGQTKVHFTN